MLLCTKKASWQSVGAAGGKAEAGFGAVRAACLMAGARAPASDGDGLTNRADTRVAEVPFRQTLTGNDNRLRRIPPTHASRAQRLLEHGLDGHRHSPKPRPDLLPLIDSVGETRHVHARILIVDISPLRSLLLLLLPPCPVSGRVSIIS